MHPFACCPSGTAAGCGPCLPCCPGPAEPAGWLLPQGRCKHYVYVSSAGAYSPNDIEPMHVEGDKRKSSAGARGAGRRWAAGWWPGRRRARWQPVPSGSRPAWQRFEGPLGKASRGAQHPPAHACAAPRPTAHQPMAGCAGGACAEGAGTPVGSAWPRPDLLFPACGRPRGCREVPGGEVDAVHRLPAAVHVSHGRGAARAHTTAGRSCSAPLGAAARRPRSGPLPAAPSNDLCPGAPAVEPPLLVGVRAGPA